MSSDKKQYGRWRPSRRALLATAGLAGGALWAGTTAARLARDPSSQKSCGRISDIDGIQLARPAPVSMPVHDPGLQWLSKGGEINDASCLSQTPVYGVVNVRSEDDVAKAMAFARANGLKISISAVRHSMGGHAFDDYALVLDMRGFNAVEVRTEDMVMTVQTGAVWHDIQNVLHPRFAVKAMQSSDIFSVGGSISVNAHGMDHHAGSVLGTVRSMRVMLADGSVVTCSRGENADLFYHVIGGYGLFGVVLTADIEITGNAVYRTSRKTVPASTFPQVFADEIENDDRLGLFYGHLSTAAKSLLNEMIIYRYDRVEGADIASIPQLGEPGAVKVKRLLLNLSKYGSVFRDLKWFAEKNLEPKVESCTVPRTAAMGEGEACLVSRNEPMHDSVPYLFNDLKNDTDILHEYFIPRPAFIAFLEDVRAAMRRHDAGVLNASVRVVHREDTALTYAPAEAFSLVLYINQSSDERGNAKMRAFTRDLIDLTIKHGGRFFLPYQLHYTGKQLLACYPELPEFLAAKRRYDPSGLFTSTWYRAVSALVANG